MSEMLSIWLARSRQRRQWPVLPRGDPWCSDHNVTQHRGHIGCTHWPQQQRGNLLVSDCPAATILSQDRSKQETQPSNNHPLGSHGFWGHERDLAWPWPRPETRWSQALLGKNRQTQENWAGAGPSGLGLGHRLGCPNPMYQGLDSPRPWTHEIATDLHRTWG